MRTFLSVWLPLAILTTLFGTGDCGLRCYQCSSEMSPRCADPFSRTNEPNGCTSEGVYVMSMLMKTLLQLKGKVLRPAKAGDKISCLKIKFKEKDSQNITIFRGCNTEKAEKEICSFILKRVRDKSRILYCGSCFSTGCNGSNRLHSAVSLTWMLLEFFALLFLPYSVR